MKKLFLFLMLTSAGYTNAQKINMGFESGLADWSSDGAGSICIDSLQGYQSSHCVRITGRRTALLRRMPVAPLALVEMHAFVRSASEDGHAYAFIRFYDSADHLLMESKGNRAQGAVYQETGVYTEAPALTAYGQLGIQKDSSLHPVYADDFRINTNIDVSYGKHPSLYDIRTAMLPFWKSDTIYNETVLLFSAHGKPANGRLLFHPAKILSVRSFDQQVEYQPQTDYTVSGNTITRRPHSAMPFKADTSFDTVHNLAWYNLQSQWISVSYVHHDKWNGPTPSAKEAGLPRTIRKLTSGAPLTIVAYGMSITRGLNVSGYDDVPPYMTSYIDLFSAALKDSYHNEKMKVYNAALPGAAIDWGAMYVQQYVTPLNPDLVIIDFGMNDFWRLTPAEFKGYVLSIVDTVRSANPNAEFIFISNMKFDPQYILPSDKNRSFYASNMTGYSAVLRQLEGRGIVTLDMTTISDAIYSRKKPRDCISNPLHPNDYMARWYAQGLIAVSLPAQPH